MINNPLVSIIVPIYNLETYIEQCCRSVFEQTYDNCEFIFIDDCGTDRSMEILYGLIEEYSQLRDRIRILYNEGNKGIALTREIGIEAASGEFVYEHFKTHWPEVIVWIIWKGRQWWVVKLLRAVKDNNCIVSNMIKILEVSAAISRKR